jgi:glucose/arabinose dehydrogenase
MKLVPSIGLACLLGLAPAVDVPAQGEGPQLDVELVAGGLVAPLDLTFAPDGRGRRFIVDQTGLVLILTPQGQVRPTPFLDITDRVVLQSAFDERGLLALAFHPDFAANGKLYVGLGDGGFIHGPSGADDPFDVDPDLLFGDLLAQDVTSIYGKILRLDVDGGDPYGIPPDNPFVGPDGIPDEIFAWGFRNPFRIAFDRGGDRAAYVSAPADTLFEATYKVAGPGNYGWAAREGTHCIVRTSAFAPPETIACSTDEQCPAGPQVSTCGASGVCTCPDVGARGEPIQDPVVEYLNFAVEDPRSRLAGRGFGRASVGGHVYRGRKIRWLRGRLVLGDFALNVLDGQILVAKEMPRGKPWTVRRAFVFDPSHPVRSGFVKSIGADADGELYAITGNFTPTGLEGRIWKIVDGSE